MNYRVLDLPNQLELYDGDKSFVTFVYETADPKRTLGIDSFFYVNSEDEIDEKINLLDADSSTLEEVIRL